MKYRIVDKKYRFISAFDTETGAYVRTGVIDANGKDTGIDPFMASFKAIVMAKSTFYYELSKTDAVLERNAPIESEVHVIIAQNKGCYGVGRVHAELVN